MTGDATRSPRGAAGQATRARLVDACLDQVWGQGYAASSIATIAQAAAAPKGSVFYYFPSKDEVVVAAVEAYVALARQRRGRELLPGPDRKLPALKRLEAYFRSRMEARRPAGFRRSCLLGNLAAEIDPEASPLVADAVRAGLAAFEADLLAVLQEAAAAGELAPGADLPALAATLVHAWEGALLRMKLLRSGGPLEEFLRSFAPFFAGRPSA